jgi:hypothetical protein
MRNYIYKHKVTILSSFAVVIGIITTLVFIGASKYAPQAYATTCSDNYSLVAYSEATNSSTTLSGITNVNINMPTSSNPQVKEILIYAATSAEAGGGSTNTTPKVIGRAVSGPTYVWNFKWATSLWPNGMVSLSAKVFYVDNLEPCVVNAQYPSTYISNSAPSLLNVQPLPTNWTGQVSSSQLFTIKSSVSSLSIDPTPYSIYKWTKLNDIGSINPIVPNGERANFLSGIIAGQNTVKVQVFYGGADRTISIPVTVREAETNDSTTPPDSTTPTDNTNNDTTPNTTDTNPNTNDSTTPPENKTQVTSSKVQNNLITQSCIEKLITTERYALINQGTVRPTTEEIKKIRTCFAASNHILPSNFSPIDPQTTKDLPVTNVAAVSKLENIIKPEEDGEMEVLRFAGTAEPNSVVVVYIYSDPLVITTTTDGDGNWEYTLEDPLEPGNHEVYAVVDKGDGTYERSDPLSFIISTASASAVNPNGLSLNLAAQPTATAVQSSDSLIIYIASSVAVLIIVPAIIYAIVVIRKKHAAKKTAMLSTNSNTSVNVPSETSTPSNTPTTPIETDNSTSSEDTSKPVTETPENNQDINNSVQLDNNEEHKEQ